MARPKWFTDEFGGSQSVSSRPDWFVEEISAPVQQESSWGDVLSNTAQRGFVQFAGGMNNLGTATLDTVSGITDSLPDWTTYMPVLGQGIQGMKSVNPYIKEFAEQGDVTRTTINEGLEALRGQVNVPEYSAKDLVGRGVEGVIAMAPHLAMAYASRNPSTLLTTLGMFSGADTQQEALDEGMGLLPATAKGAASGYLTSKIEKLPLGPDVLFSPGTGNIAKDAFNRLIWGPIKEGIEEPLENLGQRGIDMAFGDREAFSDLTTKELKDSALGGVLTGVGLSGGRYAGDKIGGSFATMAENKRQKEMQADVDTWLVDAEPTDDTGYVQPQFEETASQNAEGDTDSSQVEQKNAEQSPLQEVTEEELDQAYDDVSDANPNEILATVFGETPLPTEMLDPESVTLSKEVPNFKKGAKDTGEVEGQELSGKYNYFTGPIVVWERGNGTREVITGRHRWNLAKRNGVKVPAQIVKESDGFTAEHARTLDAELNILDGKGKLSDFVDYFQKAGINEQEAAERGLTSREKGRFGFDIGANGSPEVIALYKNSRLSAAKAAAIARGAPKNADVQQAAITRAKDLNHLELGAFTRILGDPDFEAVEAEQGNIFGDGTSQQRLEYAEQLAKLAAKEQFDAKEQYLAARSAAKRPDAAKEVDVKVGKNTGKKLDVLRKKLAQWDKWYTNPELVSQLKEKLSGSKADTPPKRQPLSSDAGVGTIISDGIEGVADFVDQRFAGSKKQKEELGPFRTENTKTEKRLSRFGGRTSQFMTLPSTMADTTADVPGSMDRYKAGRQLTHDTAQHMSDFREPLRPFGKLSKEQRKPVESFLAAQRIAAADGKQLPETDQFLTEKGFDQEQIDAIRAVRHTLSEVAPEAFRAHKLQFAKSKKQRQQINEMVDEWKKRPYVPFGRTGNWYVYVPKYDTKNQEDLSYFERFENQSDMVKRIKELQGQGFSKSSYRYGEMIKMDPSEGGINRAHLSAELDQMMEQFGLLNERLDADGKPIKGGKLSADVNSFKKHLIPAKLTPGFDTDISSSIADYLSGLSHYMAHETYDHRDAQAKAKIPSNEVQLRKYWDRYHDYLKDPSSEDPLKLRQGMAYWYLTRPMSGIVNATQNITTTMPLITEHVGVAKSYVEWTKAHKDIAKFAAGNKGFKNSELGKALTKYYEAENLADSAGNMFRSLKKGKQFKDDKKGVWKYANPMAFFQAAEDLNRGHAFIAGWNIASQKYNLKGQDRIDFASKFIDKTQFVYAKSNRPELARGPWLSTLMTFKLFFGNYLRFLRNLGVSPALGQALIHALLLGGKSALPFVKEAERILTAAGWDVDKDIDEMISKEMADEINIFMADNLGTEDFTGKVSDVVNRGVPATAGLVDLSGSLSAMELAATDQDNIFAAAGKAGLGVPGAFVHDLFASRELWKDGSYKQAVEKILPAAFKGPSKALRWGMEGKFRGNDNKPKPNTQDPSLWELVVTSIGGQAPRLSKQYQREHKEYVATAESRDNGNANRKLGFAIYKLIETGDDSRLMSVLNDIREHNANAEPHQIITPDMPAVKNEIIVQMTDANQGRQYYPKRAESIVNQIRSAP